jgi:DNA-binding NarL/FixJ family response regulator
MADAPIRIASVDDHQLVREGLAALIGSMKDLRVVGLSGDGAGGAAMILRKAPDVALLDLSMPGTDGLGVLQRLRHGGSGQESST